MSGVVAHPINVREGFRRLTAVASVLLLVAGAAITAMLYTNARRLWFEAHSQPIFVKQLVLLPGTTYSFPQDATEHEIVEAIKSKEGWKPHLNDAGQEIADYKVADIKAGDQVGYIYVPKGWWGARATSGHSVLYDRRSLLEGEQAGSLPGPVTSVVRDLRAKAALPAPPASPIRILGFAAGATVLASVVPWLLFTLASWVVRGFTTRTPGADAA